MTRNSTPLANPTWLVAVLGLVSLGCADSANPTEVSVPEVVDVASASRAAPLHPQQCRLENALRSNVGKNLTEIEFVNNTSGQIRIFWLNYQGDRVLYNTLSAGQSYVQLTYVTHPWVVTDVGGNCLAVFIPNGTASVAIIG